MTQHGDEIDLLLAGGGSGTTAPRRRRRGRGWVIAGSIVGIFVVLVVVAFFVTDGLIRSSAETIAATAIEQRLPSNVNGKVTVKIEGGPVLLQYLHGSFERIELDAPDLDANGVPLSAHLLARGVPTDLSKPVSSLDGTITLDQAGVDKALKQVPGGSSGVTLGKGVVTYDGVRDVLGVPVGYTVTAKPSIQGPDILLTPTDIHVTSGPVSLDLTGIISAALGRNPVPVCIADQLPQALHVTSVRVDPAKVDISLHAADVVLSGSTFDTKGSCG